MKRIRNIVIIALLLSGMGITILQAQTASTVTLGGTQYPVVDLTELTPLGCLLTKEECDSRKTSMKKATPASSGATIPNNVDDESWNKKMSSKFQVMNTGYSPAVDWVNAWKYCAAYDGGSDGGSGQAGQWRLPTQKEMMMIGVVYPQLLEQGLKAFATDKYWCATEGSETKAWYMDFLTGYIRATVNKTELNYVRCIRDL